MMQRITDLLDDYYDTSVSLPLESKPTAEETKARTLAKIRVRKRRRVPVGALVAACFVLVFSVTATAYYLSHEKTQALVESGPATGGNVPVELDDRSREVIETASRDYDLVAEDGASTVTLDSVMGFHSEQLSIAYFTLTVTPPEGTVFTADIGDCGFWEWFPETEEVYNASGSSTAIDNGDGTVSVMLMFTWNGDLGGVPMTLHLSDFGNVSKEVAGALNAGTRTIEVPGTWDFPIDGLQLDEPQTLQFDESLFEGSAFHPVEITVSNFGGILTTDADVALEALTEVIEQRQDIDWDSMSLEQLNLMCAAGDVFTDEEQEIIEAYLVEALENQGMNEPRAVEVQYPDGSTYAANMAVWSGTDGENHRLEAFVFEAPQNLNEAEYLVVNSVQIPLQ